LISDGEDMNKENKDGEQEIEENYSKDIVKIIISIS
jgi:hypothetical protein